jgi:hypothetical protein
MGSRDIASLFLTSALDAGKWSASLPGLFTPGKSPSFTHWIEVWVGITAGLDALEKRKVFTLPGIQPRPSIPRPSLYRLSYHGIITPYEVISNFQKLPVVYPFPFSGAGNT